MKALTLNAPRFRLALKALLLAAGDDPTRIHLHAVHLELRRRVADTRHSAALVGPRMTAARTAPTPTRCACGTAYDRTAWDALPFVAAQGFATGEAYDARRCRCGRTICVVAIEGPQEDPDASLDVFAPLRKITG